MRILIDLQGVQTDSRHRGIGRYSLALAREMLRRPRGHDLWILLNGALGRESIRDLEPLLPRDRIVSFDSVQPVHWSDRSNTWRRNVSEHLREAFIRDLRPDAVHVSSLVEGAYDQAVVSIRAKWPGVSSAATLYDLIPMREPGHLDVDWVRQRYMSKVSSFQNADLLFAISEHVRCEALELLGVAPERVVNISAAASSVFGPRVLDEGVRACLERAYGISGKYILYSGAMDARKNLDRLLAAYARLPEALQASHQLVIVGKLAELDRPRFELLARRHRLPADRWVVTGYVADEVLVDLYNGAAVFVLPSLHEGFGLPALEAMACGVPVLGSNTSSIPEVIGRKDALFDPLSVTDISGAISRVLIDGDFAAALSAHGLRRAREFSWAASASRVFDALEACSRPTQGASSWKAFALALEAGRRELIGAIAEETREGNAPSDQDLVATASAIAANQGHAAEVGRRRSALSEPLSWLLEGPFDSSYSLALVNREIALALDRLGVHVALRSTDGEGDFAPDPGFLARNPRIEHLSRRAENVDSASMEVCSRLIYPPRVSDVASRFNLLHAYAWEESLVPAEWVDHFNDFLQGISALSTHVQKALVDSGVCVPTSVCGAGIDHWERIDSDTSLQVQAKSFRFLHVSSCLPRKGVDVLLKAYGDAFTDADDVSLVIKTFANPQNDVHHWLADARQGRHDFPHVVIVERELSEGELKRLYELCDVMVAPSRAEGFGLPLAEAMISGLAVITTGWGGQRDFCSDATAWLVDYEFAPANTLFDVPYSVWAEPSRSHLSALLREVRELSPAQRETRIRNGQSLLRSRMGWLQVAERLTSFAREVHARGPATPVTAVGWVGPWYTGCSHTARALGLMRGIRTRQVILAPDNADADSGEFEVRPCWKPLSSSAAVAIAKSLADSAVGAVVVQYQPDLLSQDQFVALVQEQKRAGRAVFSLLGDADGEWSPAVVGAFRACDRLLAPSLAVLNRLRADGVIENATIFPWCTDEEHPSTARDEQTHKGGPRIVACYGQSADASARLARLVEAVGLLRARIPDLILALSQEDHSPDERMLHASDESSWVVPLADLEGSPSLVLLLDATGSAGVPGVALRALQQGADVVAFAGNSNEFHLPVARLAGDTAAALAGNLSEWLAGRARPATYQERLRRWLEATRSQRLGQLMWNMMTAQAWVADHRVGAHAVSFGADKS